MWVRASESGAHKKKSVPGQHVAVIGCRRFCFPSFTIDILGRFVPTLFCVMGEMIYWLRHPLNHYLEERHLSAKLRV